MDKAIEIAHRAELPLKIAAKVDKADLAYYNSKIKRLLRGPGVEFIARPVRERKKPSWAGQGHCYFRSIGRSRSDWS